MPRITRNWQNPVCQLITCRRRHVCAVVITLSVVTMLLPGRMARAGQPLSARETPGIDARSAGGATDATRRGPVQLVRRGEQRRTFGPPSATKSAHSDFPCQPGKTERQSPESPEVYPRERGHGGVEQSGHRAGPVLSGGLAVATSTTQSSQLTPCRRAGSPGPIAAGQPPPSATDATRTATAAGVGDAGKCPDTHRDHRSGRGRIISPVCASRINPAASRQRSGRSCINSARSRHPGRRECEKTIGRLRHHYHRRTPSQVVTHTLREMAACPLIASTRLTGFTAAASPTRAGSPRECSGSEIGSAPQIRHPCDGGAWRLRPPP